MNGLKIHEMKSRFASKCVSCGEKIEKGAEILYFPEVGNGSVIHKGCLIDLQAPIFQELSQKVGEYFGALRAENLHNPAPETADTYEPEEKPADTYIPPAKIEEIEQVDEAEEVAEVVVEPKLAPAVSPKPIIAGNAGKKLSLMDMVAKLNG